MSSVKNICFASLMTLLTVCSASCILSKVEPVDLRDYPVDTAGLDPKSCFIPYGNGSYRQLGEQDVMAMHLPDGSTASEFVSELEESQTKTTSTNFVAIFKNIFSMWKAAEIVSYSGTYYSVDQNGDTLLLSGRIILPANGEVSRIMVVNHFTIGADAECPSMELPLECIFASRGLAVIEPDYIGYGISRNHIHPYLITELTARNVIDMYWASLPFLEAVDRSPKYDDIFIWGYSQGGAAAMALLKYVQNPPKSDPHHDVAQPRVRLAMCGSGPYDIPATYDTIIGNDYTDYPCAIPMIIQGMKEGENLYDLKLEDFIYKMEVVDWMNSKQYTMQQITQMLGSKYVHDLMTPAAMNKATSTMTDLYRVMMDNSLCSGWVPCRPVYLFHSIDDNVVPYVNASNFKAQMSGYSNIQYNFGHYGNHVISYIRFLYSTVNLLYENGDIPYDIIK